MADTIDEGIKVSAMAATDSLKGEDLAMVVQDNTNKKTTIEQINNYVKENAVKDESDRATAAENQLGKAVKELSRSSIVKVNTWATAKQMCADGNASLFANIGDTISEPWIDTADNNKSYDNPWRVNHFQTVENENGDQIKGMWLQTQYCHPFGVQFSHQRAFLACPDGLSAGTYYFTLGAKWGNNAVKDKVYQFTLTKDVSEGGRIAGCYGMPDTAPSTWKAYSYGADGRTLNETVDVTERTSSDTGGTDLGVMAYTKRTGNLNSMQETAYGWNRWKYSALRQYLNSSEKKGNWWTAQDAWDIRPDQLDTKDGFLCGINEDMLAAIATTKVTTYANTVNDGGVADVTYDRVILPSLEQMYINPQIAGEGEVQEYWKELNGTDTKWQQWQTYEILKQFLVSNHQSAQSCRLRSANRDSACYTWHLYTSGNVNGGYASYAYVFEPLVFIGG